MMKVLKQYKTTKNLHEKQLAHLTQVTLMVNIFCVMVNRQNVLSRIFSRNYCQSSRYLPAQS